MTAVAAPIDQLVKQVDGLNLDAVKAKFPDTYPDLNLMDLYRAHLANVLSEVTGVDTALIYPNLGWTSGLDKGDIALPVPSLRVKGKKPDELAQEWAAKVPTSARHAMRCRAIVTLCRR